MADVDPPPPDKETGGGGGGQRDFRSRIEEKLAAKQSRLGQVEENLKKFGGDRGPPFKGGGGGSRGGPAPGADPMARFQNRLGPKVVGGGGRGGGGGGSFSLGGSLNRRLGPKVGGDEDEVGGGLVKSMVVVQSDERSREEALEEMKNKDKKDVQVRQSYTNTNKEFSRAFFPKLHAPTWK